MHQSKVVSKVGKGGGDKECAARNRRYAHFLGQKMPPVWLREGGWAAFWFDERRRAATALRVPIYDFGNSRPVSYDLIARRLDVMTGLIQDGRAFGLVILGTCMMDLDWESNRCLYEWLKRFGDSAL